MFIAEPRRRPFYRAVMLNNAALLPPGVHDMSLEEFLLVLEAKAVGFVRFFIINCSFVTSKPIPGDIDLIIVVEPGILDQREWAPREYNLLSRNRLRREVPL